MLPYCPYCPIAESLKSERPKVIRFGRFRRQSDSRVIQRFQCLACRKTFSHATFSPQVGQHKRQVNEILRRLLCSSVSQRRAAKILNLNRKTVVRKFLFLSRRARIRLDMTNLSFAPSTVIEFDDLETFEHTKCKPLSVTMAVESGTRRILGFEVAQMPAKGKLAQISRKKYGARFDHRPEARRRLFERLHFFVEEKSKIKSDQSPHYPHDVRIHFPKAEHVTFKGKRGCIVGQGELKKIGFDPLFSLNHTYAKLRADINRLARRTWCTTKRPDRLADHIALFADFHNSSLLQN